MGEKCWNLRYPDAHRFDAGEEILERKGNEQQRGAYITDMYATVDG